MLILYSTLGCHLCEHAKMVLVQVLGEGALIEEVDIADDPSLIETYGIRIPVVKNPENGREIGWPFDAEAFSRWLRLAD